MVFTNKNSKKYLAGFLAGILLVMVYGTFKTLFSFKKSIETFKPSEYTYIKRAEVENLKTFALIQIKIDSLETIKEVKIKEIYQDPEIDIQTKLNLIFNTQTK